MTFLTLVGGSGSPWRVEAQPPKENPHLPSPVDGTGCQRVRSTPPSFRALPPSSCVFACHSSNPRIRDVNIPIFVEASCARLPRRRLYERRCFFISFFHLRICFRHRASSLAISFNRFLNSLSLEHFLSSQTWKSPATPPP